MILPQNSDEMSEEELVKALIEQIGYEPAAAEWVAGVIKGTVDVEGVVM